MDDEKGQALAYLLCRMGKTETAIRRYVSRETILLGVLMTDASNSSAD